MLILVSALSRVSYVIVHIKTCHLTMRIILNVILETYIIHYDLSSLVGFDIIFPQLLESGFAGLVLSRKVETYDT